MTHAIVVTGTDTDVGKTVFAAALVAALDGYYWKPVQAGLDGETDTETVQRLAGFAVRARAAGGLPADHGRLAASRRRARWRRDRCRGAGRAPYQCRTAAGHRGRRRPAGAADPEPAADRAVRALGCTGRARRIDARSAPSTTACCPSRPCSGGGFRCSASPSSVTKMPIPNARSPTMGGVRRLGRLPHLDPLDDSLSARGFRRQLPRRRLPRTGADMTSRGGSPSGTRSRSMRLQPPMIEIAGAQGAWLDTRDGRRILDAISSWWVVTHGHRHPRIVAAIEHRAGRLDQVIFAGFTHEPAETLARGLIDIAPPGLAHVFFSDSGSTSVEVALKMALGYWRNIGDKRRRIVALEHGYHGDTIGGMSVGARGVFNAPTSRCCSTSCAFRFPRPAASRTRSTPSTAVCAAEPVAALIVEPLILGAGGMLIYDGTRAARDEAHRRGARRPVHRRRGDDRLGPHRRALFACEQAGVAPDILCLAKGLTGGSLPLAVTLCTHGDFRGASLDGPHQDVLPFELVHGQSDRLRGRHRQSRDLADRAGARTHRGARRPPTPSA